MNQIETSFTRNFFRPFRRLFLIAVLFAGAGALYGYFSTLNGVKSYLADASLILRFEREYMPSDPALSQWRGDSVRVQLDDAILTDVEILGSRRVFDTAKRKAALRGVGGPMPNLEDISIRRVGGTNVVKLTLVHSEPSYAVGYLKAFIDSYLEQRNLIFDQRALPNLVPAIEIAKNGLFVARSELLHFQEASVNTQDGSSTSPLNDELQAKLEIAEHRLRRLLELQSDYELSKELSGGSNIEILDPPLAKTRPVGPTPKSAAIVSGLIGLLFVVALAAIRATYVTLVELKAALNK